MTARPERRMPEVDVAIVGVGWAGATIAAELAKAGVDVVALERGPLRDKEASEYTRKHDELRFKARGDMLQDAARETWTLRHDEREPALPMRYPGAFSPASGVGGSSAHFGGIVSRFTPWEFELRSRTVDRYGERFLPEDSIVRDWGITYDELEPYYDRMERAVGVASRAGNIDGVAQAGGNPFEGPRSREFPLPPPKLGAAPTLFGEACQRLGYYPYPTPSAILSNDYTNPDGVARRACEYCGDCTWHLCAFGAKGDSRDALLPVAQRSPGFELRTDSYVFEVEHDGSRATGVLYRDRAGRIVHQPASVVVLAAYALNNVRLLLLSRMGAPYEPHSGSGLVGKNYAYQVTTLGHGLFADRRFQNFIGSAAGVVIDDFANDNFDHAGVGFVGGAQLIGLGIGSVIGGPPVPPGTPRWGSAWKQAMKEWFDRSAAIGGCAHSLSYRGNHLDLDPTYKDAYGYPLLRVTFDWRPNEHRLAEFAAARMREVLAEMGATAQLIPGLPDRFDGAVYQSTHNTGGAIMGTSPESSVVTTQLQMWDYPNVWVVGGSAFPQNGTPGPTGTIGALAFRAADSILDHLHRPGPVE